MTRPTIPLSTVLIDPDHDDIDSVGEAILVWFMVCAWAWALAFRLAWIWLS